MLQQRINRSSFDAQMYENMNKAAGLGECTSEYNMCFNFKARWFSHRRTMPVVGLGVNILCGFQMTQHCSTSSEVEPELL